MSKRLIVLSSVLGLWFLVFVCTWFFVLSSWFHLVIGQLFEMKVNLVKRAKYKKLSTKTKDQNPKTKKSVHHRYPSLHDMQLFFHLLGVVGAWRQLQIKLRVPDRFRQATKLSQERAAITVLRRNLGHDK